MSDRNPLKNLLKRVLKRELVTKHGARTVYSHLLQNKQNLLQNKQNHLQNKSGGSQASHHCHKSKVVQQKQQETNASSKSVHVHHQHNQNNQHKHNQHHKHKPQIKIHKVKSHIEIDQTEEKGGEKQPNKKTKKTVHKSQTKTKCNPIPESPSSPEEAPTLDEHVEVESERQTLDEGHVEMKTDLFTPPNLTPPVSRLRRTRRFGRVQKIIKFSEDE